MTYKSRKTVCPDCKSITVWLSPINDEIVTVAQAKFKSRGNRKPSQEQTINRIIGEWQAMKEAGK